MLKYIKRLIIILFAIFPLLLIVKAADITDINNLIENAKEFDGQEVTVQGEAIGEFMNRGDFSWVNINDGTNAIGIWLRKGDAEQINAFGNYKYKGDTIKITGIFYRACPEHGGEADLHSNILVIANKGYPVYEQFSHVKIVAAVFLLSIALLFLLHFYKSTKSIK